MLMQLKTVDLKKSAQKDKEQFKLKSRISEITAQFIKAKSNS